MLMDKKVDTSSSMFLGDGEPISFHADSWTSQIDDALLERFEKAIHKQTAFYQHSELAAIAREYDPIDLAKASIRLPASARLVLYRNIPDIEAKTAFILNSTSPTRQSVFRGTRNEEICLLLEQMPADEAVAVIEDLPLRRLKHIFESLEEQKAHRILALHQHQPHTAGRLMTNEFFAFSLNRTVGQAVGYIRENPGIEFTQWIFIVSDEMELLGFVPSRNLLVNTPEIPLRALMQPVVHRIEPETPRDDIVELFERYRLPVLPVVDEEHRLLGVVTQDDVVSMMEEIADETIASIGGTLESLTEDEPSIKRFCSRAPWLLVTLIAGLTTATGISLFQGYHWALAVPFFVPLIAGMSGNVGIQCSTVLVRRMATGTVLPRKFSTILFRELRIGLLIGISFGIMCGTAVYLLNHFGIQHMTVDPFLIGTMVSVGVLGTCLTATIVGTLSPLFFDRIGIDPAVASGPIVAACNDVMATYMFLCLAWSVAKLFEVMF